MNKKIPNKASNYAIKSESSRLFAGDLEKSQLLTVSELNVKAQKILEKSFDLVWVEGELSNFSAPSSGHWYFSLKDSSAQIRCAMFNHCKNKVQFKPQNGKHVIVYAKVSLYCHRGDYQLIINHIEEVGDGRWQYHFEQLKNKLAKEGLFDKQHKQAIPTLAKRLGIITSASGAAIYDILRVLANRYPLLPIVIYPTSVQGEKATQEMVNAIIMANKRKECDVLIIARGGGSLEDLECFNQEPLARAIFASDIPIVSGVGHEIDFTITDFVADHRAATPSAAAHYVSPDQTTIMQKIDDYEQLLCRYLKENLQRLQQTLQHLHSRLNQQHPRHHLQQHHQMLKQLQNRLIQIQQHLLEKKQTQLKTLSQALNAISPLATLNRGYAIVNKIDKNANASTIVRYSQTVGIKDRLHIQLSQGELDCIVEKIY